MELQTALLLGSNLEFSSVILMASVMVILMAEWLEGNSAH